MAPSSLLLSILLFQGPGDGWALVPDARQVKRLYWDLFQTTEIWLRLIPGDPEGKPPLVNLVFQAFFPGRAERDPYSGLPQEPKGPPARLVLRAQSLPLTVIRELSLRFVIDGKAVDLTGPGGCPMFAAPDASCFLLYPCEGCSANGVGVKLEPPLLEALASGKNAQGTALGYPIVLSAADRSALVEFMDRVGASGGGAGRR